MNESGRLSKSFADLYDGHPWIDVTITDTLEQVNEHVRHAKLKGKSHNRIWEILEHMIAWRENVLQRLEGKVIKTPVSNYFTEVKDTSPEAWKDMVDRFHSSQQAWLAKLDQLKEEDLEKQYPVNGMTYYENIQGILQHDAYHLGQLTLLLRLLDQQ